MRRYLLAVLVVAVGFGVIGAGSAQAATRSHASYHTLVKRIPWQIRRAFFRIGRCESGGNIHINTGNGFLGWLQFTASSWRGVGMSGMPHTSPRDKQLWGGWLLGHQQGWGAWPVCSVKTGAWRYNIRHARLKPRRLVARQVSAYGHVPV